MLEEGLVPKREEEGKRFGYITLRQLVWDSGRTREEEYNSGEKRKVTEEESS
jgi:hypothetical protein